MSAPAPSHLSELPPNSLGFLRFALASLVIYSHGHFLGGFPEEFVHQWTQGRMILGTLAVQCFFVISGWLLVHSWQRHPELLSYVRNRALRLLPAWWCCLIITAFVFAPIVFVASHGMGGFWRQDPGPIGYVLKNLFLARTQIAIGGTLANNPWGSDWNGSLWTLFYEGSAYMLLATAGMLGLFQNRARWGLAAILSLMLLNALRLVDLQPALAVRLFDTPGKLLCLHFAAGAAVGLLPAAVRHLVMSKVLGGACAVLLPFAWKLGWGPALSPCLLPPVILALAVHLPFRRWESTVGGDYSYGLYLYGYPTAQMLTFFGLHRWGYYAYALITLLVALAFAAASWQWLERPALSLKKRRVHQTLPA